MKLRILERSWKERRDSVRHAPSLMTGRKRRDNRGDNTTFEVLKTVKSIIKSV